MAVCAHVCVAMRMCCMMCIYSSHSSFDNCPVLQVWCGVLRECCTHIIQHIRKTPFVMCLYCPCVWCFAWVCTHIIQHIRTTPFVMRLYYSCVWCFAWVMYIENTTHAQSTKCCVYIAHKCGVLRKSCVMCISCSRVWRIHTHICAL